MADLTCANCGSESTTTFELANAGGTSHGQFSGMTYSQGAGLGGFGGHGIQQTQLASRLAPPRSPSFFDTTTILLFVVAVAILPIGLAIDFGGTGLLLSLIAVGGLIYWRRPRFSREAGAHHVHLERWRRSIICLRCGHTWISNP